MLLLLLLSHFSRVRLRVIPQTAATRLLHPWDFPGKVLEWGAIAFPGEVV